MIARVDDDGTLAYPVSLYELWLPNRGDDDVSLAEYCLESLGFRMSDRDRRIFPHEQHRDRFAQDGASADDHGTLALHRDFIPL